VIHPDANASALPALVPQPAGVPWPTAAWPEAQTTNEELIEAIDGGFNAPEDQMGMNLSLVVIQGGRLIAERYGPTSGPDVPLISWSMAKSFLHALVGIAAADGTIAVDAPAPVAAWSEPNDPRAAITVDQLLRMTSGLTFVEDYVDDSISHCIEMLLACL